MRFSPVPRESKGSIDRAGEALIAPSASLQEYVRAIGLAERWRAAHAYPINTFQATLRAKLRSYPGEVIVAQRLKRMPTIIEKLKRFPAMHLTTMQDIGGLRAVLPTLREVDTLSTDYRNTSRLTHQLVDQKDYIRSPRSEDGYRSIHLIYKYRNPRNPAYDGLRLELQIRTRLQHTWATAVETMGTFLGQALKSRQGDQQWIDFFAIVSSAFAHRERTPAIPRFAHLSRKETHAAVAEAESQLGALEKMRGFSIAADDIAKMRSPGRRWSYHLIVLKSIEKTVEITGYDREEFDQAIADYSIAEKQAADGAKIEPVLVSAGPIETLRRAYPNFFLDIREFIDIVQSIVSSASAHPSPHPGSTSRSLTTR